MVWGKVQGRVWARVWARFGKGLGKGSRRVQEGSLRVWPRFDQNFEAGITLSLFLKPILAEFYI